MNLRDVATVLLAAVVLLGGVARTAAEDWPQWRFDANRSADSPENLPDRLQLEWTRAFSPRVQVWDDPLNHDLMPYDRVFEPVVLGERLFVGFNDRDKVVALDLRTGRELWTFFTDGPVRLPPAAWQGKVYFASDDGHLYCVSAEDGTLVWKFRGAPSARKVLGNGRVISAWPARGGPVIRDGQVYFAASIWPFMGTFIYALDARTGAVIWVNDGTGAQFIKQPHSAPAFAGVAPQGALVATRDYLLVPGGRSVPAGFDRKTGRFLFFQLEDSGKGNGGSFVAASDSEFFVHTRLRGTRTYELKTGKKGTFTINEPVLTTNRLYSAQESSFLKAAVIEAKQKLTAARQTETDARNDIAKAEDDADAAAYKKATNALATARKKLAPAERTLAAAEKALGTNWAGYVILAVGNDKKVRWELQADGTGDIIKAGRRLYAAGTNAILAVELPAGSGQPRVAWSNPVDGRVLRLLAANGKLIAVTLDGRIMVFGDSGQTPVTLAEQSAGSIPASDASARAKKITEQCDARQGYALCFGVEDGQFIEALLRESEFHVVAVDPDAAKVEQLRRRFDAAGLYGTRVALHAGEHPLAFQAPPYLANLIVVGDSFAPRLADKEVLKTLYESVRPFGGALWVPWAKVDLGALLRPIREGALARARTGMAEDGVLIVRDGALPGSADWTHQYGNVANTVKSDDQLVKLPLGVLWFGGNTHDDVLPRHGHGPSEQIAGGRLVIEGMRGLSARDVYTGRVLWKTEFEDLGNFGVYYDASYTNAPLSTAYSQKHIPGANARGANYVVTSDAVYVIVSNACRVLDPRNGQAVRTIELPAQPDEPWPVLWGYLGVYEDVLLGGTGFAEYGRRFGLSGTNKVPVGVDLSASRELVAFNRRTGQVVWRAAARDSFLHNGIVAGNGRVYCLDKLPKSVTDRLKRRGVAAPKNYRLAAFDARTGKLVWEATTNVFGTWLSYSPQYDVLLLAGAGATDRLRDEADKGMLAYRGEDGAVLWSRLDLKYTGPCILHHDLIFTTPASYKTNAGVFGLLTGRPRSVANPLTGQAEPIRIYRTYGCNYPIAGEHLMTFRSGAAGFYDLDAHSGTGNWGGFKSGCSPNLIAANGVLNAPDYTRTCTCPYQNQTSLAFVHMPELEFWTHSQFGVGAKDGQRIKRVGVNFGAPGDRLSDTGTLWLDYPSVGGSSPNLSVIVKGSKTNYFRHHASQLQGEGPAWVMASGVREAETIIISPETRRTQPPPPAPKKQPGQEDYDDDLDKNGTDDSKKDNGKSASASTTEKAASSNKSEPFYRSALPPAAYTVRLYFAEPDNLRAGERVFGIQLQERPMLLNFDIAAEAGGSMRGIVKEFRHVLVKDQLAIGLTRAADKKPGPVICGVEMIVEEAIAGEPLPAGN